MDTPREPGVAVRAARAAVVAGVVGLVVLGVAWELWLAPTGRGTLALKVLPLLPFFPGLLRHRLPTFRALSLLVWLYVLEGVVRATTDTGLSRQLAVVELVLCAWLFIATVVYVRRRLRAGRDVAATAAA